MRWRIIAAVFALLIVVGHPSGSSEELHPTPRLNIVLIVTDDQPAQLDHMPYVNGRTDWVRFENAIINNPVCCPSRASILSGLYSHHTGVEMTKQSAVFDESNTVGKWLQDSGYRTALIGKYVNGYPWDRGATHVPDGWTDWHVSGGNPAYYNYDINHNGTVKHYGDHPHEYSTDVFARLGRDFIRNGDGKPFFLYLAPVAPHLPTTVAPRHREALKSTDFPLSPSFNEADRSDKPLYIRKRNVPADPEKMTHRQRRAAEQLLAVDDMVQSIDRTLAATGHLDDTVVMYVSDNGYSYGSHWWIGKECAYEECIRVPLLIRYPGAVGRSIESLASNIDLAPTIAEAAGATPPSSTDGKSLVDVVLGTAESVRSDVVLRSYSGDGAAKNMFGLRTPEYTYVEYENGDRELYDLENDPYQLVSRHADPAYDEIRATLAALLAQRLSAEPGTTP